MLLRIVLQLLLSRSDYGTESDVAASRLNVAAICDTNLASSSLPQKGLISDMKISTKDAASILEKYAVEGTPLLATLVWGKQFSVRVLGGLHSATIDGEPWIFIGRKDDKESDFIKFNLVGCEYQYGDLREATQSSAESAAHKIEAMLCVISKLSGASLNLFERKLTQ
jgi:hypothetical protein